MPKLDRVEFLNKSWELSDKMMKAATRKDEKQSVSLYMLAMSHIIKFLLTHEEFNDGSEDELEFFDSWAKMTRQRIVAGDDEVMLQ